MNQHSKPCQRIGSCPFHKKVGDSPEPTEETQTDSTSTPKPKPAPKEKTNAKDLPIKRGFYIFY